MNRHWRIWAPNGPEDRHHEYQVKGIRKSPFLEMLDVRTKSSSHVAREPIAFDLTRARASVVSGIVTNGGRSRPGVSLPTAAHVPSTMATSLRSSRSAGLPDYQGPGEPLRPDRITQAATFQNTGAAPDAHATPVPKQDADRAFEAAACIGCGACGLPNASAMLFTSAKASHLTFRLLCRVLPRTTKRP